MVAGVSSLGTSTGLFSSAIVVDGLWDGEKKLGISENQKQEKKNELKIRRRALNLVEMIDTVVLCRSGLVMDG